jgi:hypothetical protein
MEVIIEINSKEYRRIHDWIRRRMNNINICSHCGNTGKLDNALINGFQHERNIDNYMKLCRTCHYNYDHPNGITHSDETKTLIGKHSKERIERNGVSEKFINARKGTRISDEHRLILSQKITGENHHKNKLTENEVIEIFNSDETLINLSNKYCVSKSNIIAIKTKRTWKHLDL